MLPFALVHTENALCKEDPNTRDCVGVWRPIPYRIGSGLRVPGGSLSRPRKPSMLSEQDWVQRIFTLGIRYDADCTQWRAEDQRRISGGSGRRSLLPVASAFALAPAPPCRLHCVM
jgi:hypothetical protein